MKDKDHKNKGLKIITRVVKELYDMEIGIPQIYRSEKDLENFLGINYSLTIHLGLPNSMRNSICIRYLKKNEILVEIYPDDVFIQSESK